MERVGFWRRTFTTAGDLFLFLLGTYIFLLIYLFSKDYWDSFLIQNLLFKTTMLLVTFYNFLIFLLIPFLTKGKTIFAFVTKVRIVSQNSSKLTLKHLVKRQSILSLMWMICFVFFGIFIDPLLLDKLLNSSYVGNKFENLTQSEQLLVLIPNSLTLINMILSCICFFSTTSKNKIPFFESLSETKLTIDK